MEGALSIATGAPAERGERYRMPPMKWECKGVGYVAKTVWVNASKVAPALHPWSTEHAVRYLAKAIGGRVAIDEKQHEIAINGHRDPKFLQKSLQSFIRCFVLCSKCHAPEWQFNERTRKSHVDVVCKACGNSKAFLLEDRAAKENERAVLAFEAVRHVALCDEYAKTQEQEQNKWAFRNLQEHEEMKTWFSDTSDAARLARENEAIRDISHKLKENKDKRIGLTLEELIQSRGEQDKLSSETLLKHWQMGWDQPDSVLRQSLTIEEQNDAAHVSRLWVAILNSGQKRPIRALDRIRLPWAGDLCRAFLFLAPMQKEAETSHLGSLDFDEKTRLSRVRFQNSPERVARELVLLEAYEFLVTKGRRPLLAKWAPHVMQELWERNVLGELSLLRWSERIHAKLLRASTKKSEEKNATVLADLQNALRPFIQFLKEDDEKDDGSVGKERDESKDGSTGFEEKE